MYAVEAKISLERWIRNPPPLIGQVDLGIYLLHVQTFRILFADGFKNPDGQTVTPPYLWLHNDFARLFAIHFVQCLLVVLNREDMGHLCSRNV